MTDNRLTIVRQSPAYSTVADAMAAYDSPLYQEALKHRLKGAEYRVFIVEGLSA